MDRACPLPNFLPEYEAISGRTFRFLARKREIVREVTKGWDLNPLINGFTIIQRFQLEARIAETRPGHLIAILVASIRMHYQISADLLQLKNAGVALQGLHVIRRSSAVQESTYAGRIFDIDEDRIVLFRSERR